VEVEAVWRGNATVEVEFVGGEVVGLAAVLGFVPKSR